MVMKVKRIYQSLDQQIEQSLPQSQLKCEYVQCQRKVWDKIIINEIQKKKLQNYEKDTETRALLGRVALYWYMVAVEPSSIV